MKKILKTVAVIAIVIGVFNAVMYIECHYTKRATVVHIQNDIVTVEDNKGNLWEFKGEGYSISQKVKMTMHTNHTDDRQDDIIEKVK